MIIYIVVVIFSFVSPRTYCPFPLPSSIKPCYCTLDADKNMFLTCYVSDSDSVFSHEDLSCVAKAFDYNNKIHTLKITNGGGVCRDDCNEKISAEMNIETTGRLNIKILIVEDIQIMSNLFEYGAFDGSRGSIEEISIRFKNSEGCTFVCLPNQILEPACPTLKNLELFGVSYLPSTTFQGCANLENLILYNSNLHTLSSGVISNMANLITIAISIFPNFIIESSSFSNLANLSMLIFKKTAVFGSPFKYRETGPLPGIILVQTGAFEYLPKIDSLKFEFNVNEFEKEAFKEMIGIEYFSAFNANQTHLPRLFTNLPVQKSFLFKDKLLSFDENAFDGMPNLEKLHLSKNQGLTIINEAQFKPVIEQIGSRNGTISMPYMDCESDIKWLFSNLAWVDIFKTSTCLGYRKLKDIDTALLDELCPPNF